jgi:putative membrane protein
VRAPHAPSGQYPGWLLRWTPALLGLSWAGAAFAHAESGTSANLPWHGQWSFEPWVLTCLVLSAAWYALGTFRLWQHAGTGRGVERRQVACFAAGMAMLVLALVSPLDTLGSRLFSAHMIQHEILMIAAAPLLVVASPLAVWAWALPFEWRRAVGRFFHQPAWRVPWRFVTGTGSAWVLHALALWLWHIPRWFDAALRSEALHTLQHLSFFLTALLFWWSVLGTVARRRSGTALLSIFTTMVHTGALGAILTLSHSAWYAAYAATTYPFGLTPLQDQQLGGVVMWVPAGFVYIICGLLIATQAMGSAGTWRAGSSRNRRNASRA